MNKAKQKIKIKQVKPPNEAHFQKTWEVIKNAIEKIHSNEASSLSFEELYRNAYSMVLHRKGDVLYDGLCKDLTEHLQKKAAFIASHDVDFLAQLNKVWEAHTISMQMIRDILMYMDRTYVQQQRLATVFELGLQLFRDEVCHSPHYPILERLQDVLLSLVAQERQGELIDRGLFKSITSMLIQIGIDSSSVYVEDFEVPFLEATTEFYTLEGEKFLLSNDASVYLKEVEKRLREEDSRVDSYLDSSTKDKVQKIVEKKLIFNQMKRVIEMENTGLAPMLANDRIEDLSRMYRLFGRVPDGHLEMRKVITAHVLASGQKINEDPTASADSVSWIQQIIALKEKFDGILEKAFEKDKHFQTTINDGFKGFICENKKSPEYVSLFIDDKLKKGIKGLSEEEIEQILDKSLMLFRFLEDKDIFERYYKNHLAKRLLFKRSLSDDAERSMIAKLKTECGFQFTSKLEGMFTDMRLSDDLMANFREFLSTRSIPVELNVSVLTMTFWPLPSAPPKCNLPSEVLQSCEVFQNFYNMRHTGRRLTWQTNMGSADLRARFDKRTHELNVQTVSMAILMLFNDHDTLSYDYLQKALEVNEADLKKNLQSLACAKYKILLKNPKGKEVSEGDEFTFNAAFTAPLTKIKIQMVTSRPENEQESSETQEKVEEDRKHQIEACIVRIMKSRKKLEHNNLVAEVTKQLSSRFTPNPGVIKKRIENLIDREYLERSAEDMRMYNYLA